MSENNDMGACPVGTGLSQVEPLRVSPPDGASIPSAWLPFRCRVKAGRATYDPEKLVTPGVLYAAKRGADLTVRLVAFGWWDWHVSLLFAFKHADAPNSQEGD